MSRPMLFRRWWLELDGAVGRNAPSPNDMSSAELVTSRLARLLSFLGELQASATLALNIQSESKSVLQEREQALARNIRKTQVDLLNGQQATTEIQEQLEQATKRGLRTISDDLADASATLDERQKQLQDAMAELHLIGRGLGMLAMNAKIEATHAGQYGAGFLVVADEVNRLANAAITHSVEAAKRYDLSDVSDRMAESVTRFQKSSEDTELEIGKAFGEVVGAFGHIESSLAEVSEHHGIIEEVTQSIGSAVQRAKRRLQWSTERMLEASRSVHEPTPERQRARLEALLDADGVQYDPHYDRLRDILDRGCIRVAIEPDFVGLSFRQRPEDALEGLDVEYANALAASLGVRCEFVEAPWDTLTELLHCGLEPGVPPADVVLSALPASDTYRGLAYSESYTWLNWVLARRAGDRSIRGLSDLDGRILGIINDPGAFELLESLGVRWQANRQLAGGKIFLKELIAYSDQSRIHDCLADGAVDAFGVDLPIYHWACTDSSSPWRDKIEICGDGLSDPPYYYCVAVTATPCAYRLLSRVNAFIAEFLGSEQRRTIETRWQGEPIAHRVSYRDEAGGLPGEAELRHVWEADRLAGNR